MALCAIADECENFKNKITVYYVMNVHGLILKFLILFRTNINKQKDRDAF